MPLEAAGSDGDDLFDALPSAQEARARDWAVLVGTDAALLLVAAVRFLAQPFQPPDRLRLQPAIGEFLDAISQAGSKVAPLLLQIGRRVVLSAARRAGIRSVMVIETSRDIFDTTACLAPDM